MLYYFCISWSWSERDFETNEDAVTEIIPMVEVHLVFLCQRYLYAVFQLYVVFKRDVATVCEVPFVSTELKAALDAQV